MSRRERRNLMLLIALLLISVWSLYQAATLKDTPGLKKIRDENCPNWIC